MSVAENRELNSREVRAGKTRLRSYPLQLSLELTGVCNIVPPCVFCTERSAGITFSPHPYSYLEKYAAFVDNCERLMDCSNGEPLTTGSLFRLAERARRNGQALSFSTNGLLLDQKAADLLIEGGTRLHVNFSLNAGTPETYYRLTGQDFDRLIRNIDYYVRRYREVHGGALPEITLSYILMKVNLGEVGEFLRLVHRLGGKAMLLCLNEGVGPSRNDFGYDFVYADQFPSREDYVSVGRSARSYADEVGLPLLVAWETDRMNEVRGLGEPGVDIPCLMPWRFLVVRESSESVFGCCYHTRPLGDLRRHSLDEIWNGRPMRKIRKSLVAGKIPKFCCQYSMACPLVIEARDAERSDQPDARITMGRNDHLHLTEREGWYPVEDLPPKVRWTSGDARFTILTADAKAVCIECICFKADITQVPVTGRIEIDGQPTAPFRIGETAWITLRCPLVNPRDEDAAAVRILIDNPWKPSELSDSRDTRTLGIAVHRIWTE